MTKTTHNSFSKKALSVLLTVVMVFSYVGLLSGVFGLDLFGTKLTADAATAGKYYVRITWQVEDEGHSVDTFTHADSYSGNSNNMCGIQMYYKLDNGTGATYKAWWDIGHRHSAEATNGSNYPAYPSASWMSSACGATGAGDSASMDIHQWQEKTGLISKTYHSYTDNWYLDDVKDESHCLYATISGFPTHMYLMMDYNATLGMGAAKVKVTKIEVGKNTSNYTKVWEGTAHVDSTTDLKQVNIYADGQGTNTGSYGSGSWFFDVGHTGDGNQYVNTGYALADGSNPWQMPYVNEGSITGDAAASVELTANGTVTKEYNLSELKDQYGVVWGPDPTWSVSGGNNTCSVSSQGVPGRIKFGNGTGVDYTATVTASFASANPNHNPVNLTKDISVRARHTLTVKPNTGKWQDNANDQSVYGHTGDTSGIADPRKTAYDFVNWTVNGGSFNTDTKVYTFADRDISTMTANWTPHVYTATFKADDTPDSHNVLRDSAKDSSTNYHIENSFTLPSGEGFSKPYFTFDGTWSVISETAGTSWASGETHNIGTVLGPNEYGEVTFRAQYTPIPYEIVFNPNGGSSIRPNYDTTNLNTYHYTYISEETLPPSARLGYTFTGWKPETTVTEEWDDGVRVWDKDIAQPYGAGTTLNGKHGNVTLVAQWEAVTSHVYLDLNGGTVTDGLTDLNDYSFQNGRMIDNDPQKPGYTFAGWKVTQVPEYGDDHNTYPDDNRWVKDTVYAPDATHGGAVILDSQKLGDVTLQAQWTPIVYDLIYNSDGGTACAPIRYAIEDTVDDAEHQNAPVSGSFLLPTPVKKGWSFDGWAANPTYAGDTELNWTSALYAGGSTVSGLYGNVTLKAQWTATPYTVTFDKNCTDPNVAAPDPITYTVENPKALPQLSRTGFTFKGWDVDTSHLEASSIWSDDATAPRHYDASLPAGTYGKVNLIAQWEHTGYTLIKIGGTEQTSQTYYIDVPFTLGDSTKPGRHFVDWTVDADVGNWVAGTHYSATDSISGMYGNSNSNVSLTANFEADPYAITYKDRNGETITSFGEGVPFTAGYTIETSITLPAYSVDGYTFNGWKVTNISSGGGWSNGSVYPPGIYDAGQKFGNVTLVPDLTPDEYQITYNSTGTTYPPQTYDIESTDTLPSPTKTGYLFAGWKVTTAGGNWSLTEDPIPGGTAVTGRYGNVTLTAQWTAKRIPVKFIVGNTTLYPDGIVRMGTYNEMVEDDLTAEEKAKPADAQYTYTFARWEPALGRITDENGNYTYTAVYTETLNSYHVKWYVPTDNNSVPDAYVVKKTTVVDYGTMPDYGGVPTMDSDNPGTYQWSFEGWATSIGGAAIAADSLPAVTGETEYFAVFSMEYNPIKVTWQVGEEPYPVTSVGVGKNPKWTGAVPTKPDEDGYRFVFDGWIDVATGDEYPIGTELPVVEIGAPDRTYKPYFHPEKQDYSITLTLNGGETTAPLAYQYQMGDAVTFPAPTKAGYRFTGWLLDAAAGTWTAGTVVQAGEFSTNTLWGSVSFTAQWEAVEYTISFAAAAENSDIPASVTYTIESTDPIPAVSSEGYALGGWIVSVGGGNWTQGATLEADYVLNGNYGNVTLTPVWNVKSYPITWNSGDYSQVSWVEYGSAIMAYTPNPKMGYTAEWDAEIPLTMPAMELTFNAVYTAVEYYVRLNSNGGSAVENFYYTIDGNHTLPTPTRDGATFIGWKVATAQGNWSKNTVVDGGASLNGKYGNVSLVAQWTLRQHTVSWKLDTGELIRESIWFYGAVPSFDGTPYKAPDGSYQYTFKGWALTADGAVVEDDLPPVTADVSFYAQFEKEERTYKVFWRINGVSVEDEKAYHYGDTPVYDGATPTRDSTELFEFTFSGWSPEIHSIDGDITYEAQFTVFKKLKAVTLDVSERHLELEDSYTLTATLTPADANVRDVVWTSSDPTVAAIDANGKITALGPGFTVIKAASVDNTHSAYCVVTVAPRHTNYVEISAGGVSTTQLAGAMLQLSATILPDNATDTGIRWSSDDLAVATVDQSGLVKFVGVGETDIRAVASDGFSMGSIHVVTTTDQSEVEDTVKTYLITFGEFAPGFKLSEDGETYRSGRMFVAEGDSVSFKLAVDDSRQGRYTVYENSTVIRSGDGYWYTLEDVHDNKVIRFTDSPADVGTPEEDDGGINIGGIDIGGNNGMSFFQRIAAFFRKIVEFFRGIFNR